MGKVFEALNKAMADDPVSSVSDAVETAAKCEPNKADDVPVEELVDAPQSGFDDFGDISAWDEKLSIFAESSSAIGEAFKAYSDHECYARGGQKLDLRKSWHLIGPRNGTTRPAG